MYLKSLVLKGFKSFANRSVLTFRPGISAIVGPNGSGKSNISDAVLWVLGELNPKHLRGNKMEDVIFAGSSAKKPVSMAEVTLVLDNSDGTLPVDFDEVAITRRMYRSGESEYLINNTLARRMDVLDILHDSGLGTGTSSIISQGHLNSVLASKPEDRRALIEEAAGILKHKQRRKRSLRKLERMDQSMVRVHDIVSEIQRQVRPVARKARNAKRHKELSDELAHVKLLLAVDDLRTMQKEWDTLQQKKDTAAHVLSQRTSELHRAEGQLATLQQQLQHDSQQAGHASDQYRRAQMIVDKLESNVMLLHQREQSALDYMDEMSNSVGVQQTQIEGLQQELHTSEAELLDAKKAQQQSAARVAKAAEKEAQCRRVRNDIQHSLDTTYADRKKHNETLREQQTKLNDLRQKLNDAYARERSLGERHQRLQKALTETTKHRDTAQEKERLARKDLEEKNRALQTLKDQMSASRDARNALRTQADVEQDTWTALKAKIAGLQEIERAHSIQNPLYAWAKEHADATAHVTRLLDVLDVPQNLSALVAEILDKDIDSFVVKRSQDAQDVAKKAQQANASGRLIVRASDTTQGDHTDVQHNGFLQKTALGDELDNHDGAHSVPDEDEHIYSLAGALSYPQAYRNVCQSLFGDVYVCDDGDAAFQYAQKYPHFRFITPDGSIYGPDGRVVVERTEEKEDDNPVARHHEIVQAHKDLDASDAKRRSLKEQLSACDAKIDTISQKIQVASQEKAQCEGAIAAVHADFQRAYGQVESLTSQIHHVEENLAHAKKRVVDLQPQVNAAEKAREEAQRALAHVGNDSDELERKLGPARSDLESATNELVNARSADAAVHERVRSAQRFIDQRKADITSQRAQIFQGKKSLHRKAVARDRITPLINICETLVSEAKVRTSSLSDAAHQTQQASDELHQKIADATTDVQKRRQAYEVAQKSSSDIRVDEGQMHMRVTSAMHVISDDCHTPVEKALELPPVDDRGKTEQEAFDLSRKIKRLGNVDPDALEEYQALSRRLEYLQAQVNDMNQARASLSKIVHYIDRRMQSDFQDTFAEVNENYQQIFKKLFPGGMGKLVLTNPESPKDSGVEVIAQPRGKRFFKMSLLSGGEQSLVAMALLFALYKTRSTPFYILDEVEAALDDTNLRRLLSYINSMRDHMQFIAITHQRRTMELADVLFGISMQADGISHVISQRLSQASNPNIGAKEEMHDGSSATQEQLERANEDLTKS